MRLDLVNVAKNPGTLIKVEGLHPSGSKVVSIPSYYSIDDGSIKLNLKRIGPFQVETIQLKVIFAKTGTYAFDPCLFYVNELGEARTSKAKPATITAHLSFSEAKLEGVAKAVALKLEFKSEAAEKAFNFLVSAFMEDSVGKRLPPERSGWRTLTEVAKKAQIPMYSLYGRYRKGGEALQELMRLGIVESRFLTGERGRGGRILKLRIFYERKM